MHCYKDGNAFEVGFTTADGITIAVLTLAPDDIKEITHEVL